VAVGTLLASTTVSAQAQQFGVFRTALNANGVLSPDGSTLSFPLFRQDLNSSLTVNVSSIGAIGTMAEASAYGYVNVKLAGVAGSYFYTGAFPALASELTGLEAALTVAGLQMTAVVNQTAGLSQPITTVHIEGTSTTTAKKLADSLLTVLGTISSPQQNVTVSEVADTTIDAIANSAGSIPAKFAKLINGPDSVFTILDGNALMYSLPIKKSVGVMLGGVPATVSLGVGQTVIISGDGSAVITAELALTPGEVIKVTKLLMDGGFTLSSEGDYFVDDTPRMTFLHVVGTANLATEANFLAQATALGNALSYIRTGN
jgi:hypothetical protein